MLIRCRQTSCVLSVTLAAALALPASDAEARKDKKEDVVALFFAAKGNPNKKLYAAVYNELTRAARKAKTIRLLQGAALKKALKRKPDPLMAKCGEKTDCISKLGRAAGAGRVITVYISPARTNIAVDLLVIDVAMKALITKIEAEVSSTAKAGELIAGHEDSLFGAGAAPASAEEIPLDLILEETPPAVASSAGEPIDSDELPLDLALAAPPPKIEPKPALPEPPVETDVVRDRPPQEVLTAVAAPSIVTSPPPAGRSRLWSYVGIGVAGLGAAALGTGGYFGLQSSSTRDSVRRGADGDTQLEGKRKQDDANSLASRANLLFGIGGGLLAAGASLVTIDLFVLDTNEPRPQLSVGRGGAALSVIWSY